MAYAWARTALFWFTQTWDTLTRKKRIEKTVENTKLPRVLGLVDLTAMGVASTLGMGVYVMAGSIAKIAGPAGSICFFISGFAAALSALCYAEFAARVPKAGSAYVYSYVAVGEFTAFVVGWNIAMEYVIGSACVARSISGYIDALLDERISKYLSEAYPIDFPYLSNYLDFFALFITIFFTGLLAIGVIISANFTKVLTTLNLITVGVVIAAGAVKANFHNWALTPEEIPAGSNGGAGGFLPFGYASILSGAARSFYAYAGFDSVATTGDEAKNPKRNVPLALILTLFIAFSAYLGISASLTLMWPYYDQYTPAPFPYAFEKANLGGLKWIVTSGALCSLCACMVGVSYSMSRIIYSMASDGLLYKSLAYVNNRLKTPLCAIAIVGTFTGTVSVVFDVEMLVDMTSIGTLSAYTIVSVCVLILRYETNTDYENTEEEKSKPNLIENNKGLNSEKESQKNNTETNKSFVNLLLNLNHVSDKNNQQQEPTATTSLVVKWMTLVMLIALLVLCACVTRLHVYLTQSNPIVLTALAVSVVVLIFTIFIISRQPQSTEELSFKVKFVPILPIVNTFMNVGLMMMLNLHTWVRFLIWMAIGFVIYFSYGIRHSSETKRNKEKRSNSNKNVVQTTEDNNESIPI